MDFKNLKRKLVQDIIPFRSYAPKIIFDNTRIKELALQNYLSFGKFFLAFFLLTILVWSNLQSVWAPTFSFVNQAEAVSAEEKAALEKELAEIEKQIAQYETLLQTTQTEKSTLQNKVKELKTKASKLILQIKATNLALSDLNVRLDDTSDAINKTTVKISSAQKNLAGALEALYEEGQTSLIEMLLASDQISDYYNEVSALNALQDKIQGQLAEIKDLKINLDTQKGSLEEKKDETQNLLAVQYLQKQDLEGNKVEQEQLLAVTQGKESQYQKVLAESRKKAAEIKSRIYEMAGVKKNVTFGEALDIATEIKNQI
ncbi:MAG: hypothetical protein NTW73_01630 [Candidatus Parcubacteria bacterium]|nr:hypothetical protein [Candidatus Parcubacteria bacterium]